MPFRRVLLHGMVVDETGAKMSKVKGNTIDPLDLIHGADFKAVVAKASPGAPEAEALKKFQKAYPSTAKMGQGFEPYGGDALRMTLCSYSPQAKRIALSPKRFEGYRNFCNKVYNAVRYSLTHIEDASVTTEPPKVTLLINRWILSRLSKVVEESTRGIEDFRLDEGTQALYHFLWDELCDWYLEASKPVFSGGSDAEKEETRNTLAHVIEATLRALHPYMPFITEELWQRVPKPAASPKSIALCSYPDASVGVADDQAESDFEVLQGAISGARTIRTEYQVHPGAKVPLALRSADARIRELLAQEQLLVETLVKSDGAPEVQAPDAPRIAGSVVSVVGAVDVVVGLKGLVEASKEAERIERGLKKLEKDVVSLQKRLENPKFLENAPPEVVAEVREQLGSLEAQRGRLEEAKQLVAELEG
ncbi:MAG: class I tRNA ligase family protein [Polyangiaceae bacterium]